MEEQKAIFYRSIEGFFQQFIWRNNIMLRRIVILTVVAAPLQLAMVTDVSADFMTITDAEQFVGAGIGYKTEGIDNRYLDEIIPDPPQRLGDAYLNISLAQYGASLSGSLASEFEDGRFTVNGSSTASSEWGNNPSGANDVHGGSGASFTLNFTKDATPAYFRITGQISLNMNRFPNLHPEETLVYVRLSTDDEGTLTKLWEVALDGRDDETSMTLDHGLWLEDDKKYILEAYTETGTTADPEHSELHSRTASFSFTAIVDETDSSDRYFLKDYFPLTEGIVWNYLQTYADGHKNYEAHCIGGTQLINNIMTHKMWVFDNGELYWNDYAYGCIAWTKEGLTKYKSVRSDGSYTIITPPATRFPASIRLGETFKHSSEITEYDKYDHITATWPYSIELTLERVEDIEVLAGSFARCLKLSGTETNEGQEAEIIYWLAPGVGEVKRAIPDEEERELIYFTDRGKIYYPVD